MSKQWGGIYISPNREYHITREAGETLAEGKVCSLWRQAMQDFIDASAKLHTFEGGDIRKLSKKVFL